MKQPGLFAILVIAGFFASIYFGITLFFFSAMLMDGAVCTQYWYCPIAKGLGRLAMIMGFGSPFIGPIFGAVIYALIQRPGKRKEAPGTAPETGFDQ